MTVEQKQSVLKRLDGCVNWLIHLTGEFDAGCAVSIRLGTVKRALDEIVTELEKSENKEAQ